MSDQPEDGTLDGLPPVPPPEPDKPSLRGQRHGIPLARLCVAALKAKREDYPDYPAPCASCVFTEGSVANMTHPRVMDAMKAVLEKRPMVCPCHPDSDIGVEPCAGWMLSIAARHGQEPLETPWPYSFQEELGETYVHAGCDGADMETASRVSDSIKFGGKEIRLIAVDDLPPRPELKVLGVSKDRTVVPFIHPQPKGKQ